MSDMQNIVEVQCADCGEYHPQDHEVAQALGIQAWTQHALEDHPTGRIARLLDDVMLEGWMKEGRASW